MEGAEDNDSIQLLYSIICKHAPAVEHEEIKRVLGREMVEENEMLLDELMALQEIAGEFESETEEASARHREAQKLLMPDRERLLHNISFFIENIDRAATPAAGRRPHTGPLPVASTPREQAVIDYVSSELNIEPPSARAPGSPAMAMAGTLRPGTARSTSDRGRPTSAPVQAAAHSKVRALDMDSTKEELRTQLREENQHLLQQVELVRLRLEDASDFRHQVIDAPTPSVQDIRDLEQKLERMSVAQESLLDIMQRQTSTESPTSSPKSTQVAHGRALAAAPAPAAPAPTNSMSPIPPPPKGSSKVKQRLLKTVSIDCSAMT